MTNEDLRDILLQKNYEIDIRNDSFIAEPVDEVPSKEDVFEIYEMLDEYFYALGYKTTRSRDGVIIGYRNAKALDGMVSEIDIHLKSLDDAISEQGQLFSNITQAMDRFLRDFDRAIAKLDDGLEIEVNLSDNSPFKKLTKQELRNRAIVEKTWNELPKYMYFPEEVAVFEKEYQAILEELPNLEKKFLIRSLTGTLGFLKKLPEETRSTEDVNTVKKFATRIQKVFDSTQVKINYNLGQLMSIRSIDALIIELEKIVELLKS